MNQLHLHVLGSGSRGNAVLIQSNNNLIAIDAGFSFKQLTERAQKLGFSFADVQALFLTHEHSDHTKGLEMIQKRTHIPCFTTQETAQSTEKLSALSFEGICPGDSIAVGDITITSFKTSHDAINPIGFRIETSDDALGYCTDTGYLTAAAFQGLFDVRILALESNHCPKMLKEGEYPIHLKKRIASNQGHLSNNQAREALGQLITDRSEHIIAMHLSAQNNTPRTCLKALSKALENSTAAPVQPAIHSHSDIPTLSCASQAIPKSFY